MALSGGGDSLALTLITDAWAQEAGRGLLILTVDHGLQAEGQAWVEACAEIAARLSRPFRSLHWAGEKPSTGLPAAARRARHALLADAAREAGARVILMGHTADDRREAAVMRAAGSTVPDPGEWAPSPAWPQGRGVFLLRPLLDVRRADLRAWLAARGETWIEDPANADPRYARSRARLTRTRSPGRASAAPLALAAEASEQSGVVIIARDRLRTAAPQDVSRFVALACVCAGGGDRRPAGPRIARAAEAIAGPDRFVSTLAGARIEADGELVRIAREAGEAARGGLRPLDLPGGQEIVWDGRFAVTSQTAGLVVRPNRRGAPTIEWASGSGEGGTPPVAITSLVGARLRAAAGLIAREPA